MRSALFKGMAVDFRALEEYRADVDGVKGATPPLPRQGQ